MKQTMRSLFVLATTIAALLGVTAASSSAAAPPGGCATAAGFFSQDASLFPATQAVDDHGNQDGLVCVKILNTAPTAHVGFVIIDDTVQ